MPLPPLGLKRFAYFNSDVNSKLTVCWPAQASETSISGQGSNLQDRDGVFLLKFLRGQAVYNLRTPRTLDEFRTERYMLLKKRLFVEWLIHNRLIAVDLYFCFVD